MLTRKKQTLWARAAIMLLFATLSMVATAQSFIVVDKNGKRTTYDVSKLDSVSFQSSSPSFTVHEATDDGKGKATKYTFDQVQNFSGDPDFLFAHPDTVYVGGEAEKFKFQFRTNVDYTYKLSDDWLEYVSPVNNTDSLLFNATMNPMTTKRVGYVAFASKDEQIVDTLWVVQAGKLDSRYIDIDWTTTTLDSFDEESGKASLTFTGDVPVMGDYDVVLLPKDDSYVIRLIDKIEQKEGTKTVNLTTRQGVMGNLFKGTKFSLATEASAKARGDNDGVPVYLPTKVEMMTDDGCVELYNADKAKTRAPQGFENEFIKWEYNQDGLELWSSGVQSLSWDKLNFNIGLKGLFSFDFGDKEWEKVRMGDLQNLKITLEGGFDMEMILKYAVASEVKYEKEWTLKENAIPNLKYTFMVGTVPVYITVGADLMANVSLGASGEASITTGVTASTKVNYGVEWDYEKGLSKIAECEKNLELVGPDLDINAHAEARATAYPKIEIGIYKVLCPTISPQPYIKAEADGRLVDNSKVAWNAGVSTGIDLGLGLCLDLFFWKKDLGEIDPINLFDLPIVSLPDEIELFNEPKEEEVLINAKREVKYHVTNKNYLTGTTYNAPGVLVHFEAEGGELEDEYGYTDSEGNVSAFFTLTDTKGGTVKTEVVLGAEPEKEEDAMKADDWQAIAIDHRLTPSPASQEIKKDATAAIIYKLERYTSKTGEWTGFGGQTIQFEATGGTVAPTSGVTAQDGTLAVTFTPEADATEGKVTGSTAGKDPDPWGKVSSATVKVKEEGDDDDDIADEGLKKASKQKPNVYVIEDKKTGESQTRKYVSEWSEWNKDQDAISFQLEDADENGGTLGGIWGFIPLTMTDVVLALTGEQFVNTPGAKFSFDVYEGTQLSANFMSMTEHTEGNIQPESKIMLRKVKSDGSNARTRNGDNYSGEYELLFYLVFKNQTWNQETGEEEEGDDYEVYGRGTMAMHIPTITSFQLKTEDQYVKVGETTKVSVTQYYEKEAEWNWSDVELVAQYVDYDDRDKDLGFFSWDAATQTLTAVKPNDNKQVSLTFALKSKPNVKEYINIAVGEGWKYTSFTVGPAEQEVSAGSGGCSFCIEDFAPKDNEDEAFDNTSIEIDPESDPDDNFRYYDWNNKYSPRLDVYRSNIAPGEYNIRFRLKSDHSIGSTMKITVISESTDE